MKDFILNVDELESCVERVSRKVRKDENWLKDWKCLVVLLYDEEDISPRQRLWYLSLFCCKCGLALYMGSGRRQNHRGGGRTGYSVFRLVGTFFLEPFPKQD
jgi:hypothetical protein